MNLLDESTIELNPYTRLNIFCFAQAEHSHTFFEFALITEGHCYHTLNGGNREILERGTLILLRPCDYHSIDFVNRDCQYRDFYVTTKKMQKICNIFGADFYNELMQEIKPLKFNLSVGEFSTIENRAYQIAHADYNKLGSNELPEQIHTSLIIELLTKYIEKNINKSSLIPEWLNNLYLRLTYFDYINLSIDEIVKKTGFSHGYICQMFKKHFATSLIAYHNRHKILYSCRYLSKLKIIDVASLFGWENPKNYSIEFKKVFNISPREYINTQKQNPNLATPTEIGTV